MRQQFHRGDLVRTLPIMWGVSYLGLGFGADDNVRHPPFYGIIVGSYRDQYGGGKENRHKYSVLQLHDDGTVDHEWSWLDDEEIDYLVEPRCIEHLDFLDLHEEDDD